MASHKDHTPRPNSLFEGDGVDLSPAKAWPPKSPVDDCVLRAQGSSQATCGPSEGAAIYPRLQVEPHNSVFRGTRTSTTDDR